MVFLLRSLIFSKRVMLVTPSSESVAAKIVINFGVAKKLSRLVADCGHMTAPVETEEPRRGAFRKEPGRGISLL